MIIKIHPRYCGKENGILAEVASVMGKDIEFGGFVVIDGKQYVHVEYDTEDDVLYVIPCLLFTDEDAIEVVYERNIVCPYCHFEDQNSWEYEADIREVECPECTSLFEYEREIEISYSTKPIKVAPIQILKRGMDNE